MKIKPYSKDIYIYLLCTVLMSLLLYPIIWVGLHNYPSGDDYWFGAYTYQGYNEGGLIGAVKGSCHMVEEIYYTWQGTWFTLFLFTLSPQNFNEHGYVLTVFISLIGLAIAEFTILKRYIYNEYGFSKMSLVSLFFIVFNLSIQYIPRTTSGIFWFNGIMHYTIPFMIAMGCISSSRLILKNDATSKKYTLRKIFVILGMIALGGSNYLAAIIGLAGMCYEISLVLYRQISIGKKVGINKYLVFIVAIVMEFVGLYISYKSPGNSIRANDDMSFRPKYFINCIWWSIDRSRIKMNEMISERPIIWIYILVIVILVGVELRKRYESDGCYKRLIEHPIWAIVFCLGTQAASYMPEVYAASDVSGGVPNTHYWMLLLLLLATAVVVIDSIYAVISFFCKKKESNQMVIDREKMEVIRFCVAFISVIAITGSIIGGGTKTTNDYCNEYINSGRMSTYEKVWWEQYRIYTDATIKEALIPEYYGDVYPILHMVIEESEEGGQNLLRAKYYGKEYVKAYNYE